MALYQFNGQLMHAVQSQNGDKAGALFSKNSLRNKKRKSLQLAPIVDLEPALEKIPNIDDYCSGQVQSPWDEFAAFHFKGLLAIYKNNFVEAYQHQTNLSSAFIKYFQVETNNWALPVFNAINRDLRLVAKKADYFLRSKGQKKMIN